MLKKVMAGSVLWSMLLAKVVLAEQAGPFNISAVSVYNAGNMAFRVFGIGQTTSCPGQSWAYVDEGDSASKIKISTLLSAYTAGKSVTLQLNPVNFFGNGVMYCQITSITSQ